ncbi:MAG: hypothetical protein QXN55_01535 [Candidatus Nitrosotenuis sp.]
MTNYVIKHADESLPNIELVPNTTITPNHPASQTSLTLFGKGAANYGEGQQQNFLQMLENFALDISPSHPQKGQLWYNTTEKRMKVFDGTHWKPVSGIIVDDGLPTEPPAFDFSDFWWDTTHQKLKTWDGGKWAVVYPVPIRIAYIDEYNDMVKTINEIIGTPQGTTSADAIGYGQALIPTWPSNIEMKNSDWTFILDVIRRIGQIEGQPTDVISDISPFGFIHDSTSSISFGIITSIQNFTTTYNTLNIFKNDVNSFGYYGTPVLFNTVASTVGSPQRTAAWNSTKSFTETFTFASATAAKAFFNSGGLLTIGGYVDTTGQPPGSPGEAWTTMFSDMGDISIGKVATFRNGDVYFNAGGSGSVGTGGFGHGPFGTSTFLFGGSNFVPNTISLGFYDLTDINQVYYQAISEDGYRQLTIYFRLINGGTTVEASVEMAVLPGMPGPINGRVQLNTYVTKLIDSVEQNALWTFVSGQTWSVVVNSPVVAIDATSTFLDSSL